MAKYTYQAKLESNRLRTRWLTKEDTALWTLFFDDKTSVAFLPDFGVTTSKDKARIWIDRQLQRYSEHRYGMQALIEKTSNEFIGQCGLLSQEVDGINELEVGYHIFKDFRGKGYAPEAAKLFIDYAFQNNLAPSIISIIDIKNKSSQIVAEKNGLVLDKQTTFSNHDVYIYRIWMK